MKKKFKTDSKILNLMWPDFDKKCFPRNLSASITQARLFFFKRVVWENFDDTKKVSVFDILQFLNTKKPEYFLAMRGVGAKRMQNTIQCLLNVGIHPNDISKYKKWLKEYSKLHP